MWNRTRIHFLIVILALTSAVVAEANVLSDAPGEDYVWVEPYEMPSGEVIEGFWRKMDEYGQLWVEPYYADNDEFVDAGWVEVPVPDDVSDVQWEPSTLAADGDIREGYWRLDEREGFAWGDSGWESVETYDEDLVYEPGYVSERHVWVRGFYRPRVRTGYGWRSAYYSAGAYHYGYWNPLVPNDGYVYVPGHVGGNGYWVDGFYRPLVYSGYSWTPGYYFAGAWFWGCWSPGYARYGHIYTPGYSHHGHWVAGHWRAESRHGHYWSHGQVKSGVYHKGSWVKGTKKKTYSSVQYATNGGSTSKPSVHYASGSPSGAKSAAEVRTSGRPVASNDRAGRNANERYGKSVPLVEHRSKEGARRETTSARGSRTGNGESAKGSRDMRNGKRPAGKNARRSSPKGRKALRSTGARTGVRTGKDLRARRASKPLSRAQRLRGTGAPSRGAVSQPAGSSKTKASRRAAARPSREKQSRPARAATSRTSRETRGTSVRASSPRKSKASNSKKRQKKASRSIRSSSGKRKVRGTPKGSRSKVRTERGGRKASPAKSVSRTTRSPRGTASTASVKSR